MYSRIYQVASKFNVSLRGRKKGSSLVCKHLYLAVAEHDVKEPGKIEALLGAIKPHHPEKEAHVSIDENTPISEVKDPSIFERAKEEVDAFAQAVQQKKEFSSDTSLPVENQRKTAPLYW
ncbi:hypothetical protein Droror1_Dr00027839 [Drosera rotundifolia]